MNITVQRLSDEVCAAPQLPPEAMAAVAQAGFRSVVNNRPDFEGGPDQPTSAQMEAAARAAGLEYVFLPVASNHQTPEQIAEFAALLEHLPKPMLAFCRSGTRSGKLYAQAMALKG
ncbi:MAG TPA: TIGR01244 family sulfur transferase [Burkholderiaceae bacterium]|jgi:uncharacterized protein (TIGR01244 family)|nr:TIGR01244 family sulfur transferase [Burkholderiaceae bacterium]